jgi:hypothetical protein
MSPPPGDASGGKDSGGEEGGIDALLDSPFGAHGWSSEEGEVKVKNLEL